MRPDGRFRRDGVLYGSTEPRIFTKPLRELTAQTSLGFMVADFAREVLDIGLFPWQRWLLIHALELAPGLTYDTLGDRGPLQPMFRFRKVLVLVARQNGKSTLSQVLSLFFLYSLGVALILGTAQDLDTAEEVWDGVWDIIESNAELAPLALPPIRVNGKKTIRLKNDPDLGVHGSRYKVKAATRKAARGLSGDLVILDELREHQSWDAWAAITKTTQARPAAQIWTFSNAGDASSVVLKSLRRMAHVEVGDPDGVASTASDFDPESVDGEVLADEDASTLGIFEWSSTPGCAVTDRDEWPLSNPSLGFGISESTIAGDAATEGRDPDTEWVFRTEVLCQWPDGVTRGPFPAGAWDKTLNQVIEGVDGSRTIAEVDRIQPPFRVALDMSHDRSRTVILRAGFRADGVAQVEVWDARFGASWVRGFLDEHAAEISAVTGQTNGAPVSSLLEGLKGDPKFTVPVVDLAGADLGKAFGLAYDAVRDGEVRHNPQPVLDVAAATAVVREMGESKLIDRRASTADASPLVAFCAAFWLLKRPVRQSAPAPKPVVAVGRGGRDGRRSRSFRSGGRSVASMGF